MRLKIFQMLIYIIFCVLLWPASPEDNFPGFCEAQEVFSLISEDILCAGNSCMPNHPDSQLMIANDDEKIWELFERKKGISPLLRKYFYDLQLTSNIHHTVNSNLY